MNYCNMSLFLLFLLKVERLGTDRTYQFSSSVWQKYFLADQASYWQNLIQSLFLIIQLRIFSFGLFEFSKFLILLHLGSVFHLNPHDSIFIEDIYSEICRFNAHFCLNLPDSVSVFLHPVLRQSTSQLVRHILKNWINNMRKKEEVNRKNNTSPQGQMPMRTTYQAPVSSIF
jgi:hypothetical protein